MIITISDTRTPETDRSGLLIRELMEDAGYRIVLYRIVKDDFTHIQSAIQEGAFDSSVEAILLNGGLRHVMR
jgi:molybdenum cofactor biosynthesis protein B